MRMRIVFTLAGLALSMATVGTVSSSAQSTEYHRKVFGYQDQNGVFHAINHPEPDATVTPTTGTIELTLTITLKTPLPKGGVVICGADISATSTNLSTAMTAVYEEQANSLATVSGSTATCTVNVPYEWAIAAASTTVEDGLTGSYTIEMATATGTLPGLVRLTDSNFLSATKIPATGTVSKFTVAATL